MALSVKSRGFPKWLVLGVALSVAATGMLSIILLRRWADRSFEIRAQIVELHLLLHYIDAFEWKAIAVKELKPELRQNLELSKQKFDIVSAKLPDSVSNRPLRAAVSEAHQKYINALERELALVPQGKLDEVLTLSQTLTHPAYEELEELLEENEAFIENIAWQTNQQADIGTILSILVAATTICLIVQKIERANQLVERSQAEQTILKQEQELLEDRVTERTQELDAKNQDLTVALSQLQAAQTELIQSEKMAALGHLVAGIAHEINTPLGAIQASTGNITKALPEALDTLPYISQKLTIEQQADFFTLLGRSLSSKAIVSSTEKRPLKRKLIGELEALNFDNARQLADKLVDIGIYGGIEPFIPLFKSDNSSWLLQLIYNLNRLQANNRTIQTAVDRASKIVFALKSYARFDRTGEKKLAQAVEGIETVLELYHNQLKQGIEVIRHYQPVPEIWVYPDELVQVWTNLIHNAIQAMNHKGKLKIDTYVEKDNLVVQIADSGSGIPPETLPQIFEPFFTTKPAGEGNGLGLSISRTIVEKHGGIIEALSQPGETKFRVALPLNSESHPVDKTDNQENTLSLNHV